ncbi:MAG TPA: hypothetical protein VIY08_07280 [Candidatus Nitrosocosmicus sp.]
MNHEKSIAEIIDGMQDGFGVSVFADIKNQKCTKLLYVVKNLELLRFKWWDRSIHHL